MLLGLTLNFWLLWKNLRILIRLLLYLRNLVYLISLIRLFRLLILVESTLLLRLAFTCFMNNNFYLLVILPFIVYRLLIWRLLLLITFFRTFTSFIFFIINLDIINLISRLMKNFLYNLRSSFNKFYTSSYNFVCNNLVRVIILNLIDYISTLYFLLWMVYNFLCLITIVIYFW